MQLFDFIFFVYWSVKKYSNLAYSDKYDERKLSGQLQNGDIIAFESVYHHYKEKLYYFVLKYLGNKQDAEGIVQNAFISLWEHRATIDPDQPLKSYLFKITTNLMYNHLKRLVLKNKYFQNAAFGLTEEEDTAHKELYYRDLKEAINKIVDEMPEQQQLIFKLSRWGDMSHNEIAAKLKISVRTVENQIYRATRLLKDHLKDKFFLALVLSIFL